jgi:hypothetical protein
MDSNVKSDDFLRQFQRFLEEENLSHQTSQVRWATMKKLFLDAIRSNIGRDAYDILIPIESTVIAYTNGRPLSKEEFSNLNEEDCDIVLNVVEGTLKFRRNPEKKHSKLELSPLRDFGRARFGFLATWLRRPNIRMTVDNMPTSLDDFEPKGEDTLRKTISVVRKALGAPGRNNLYILTDRFVKGYRLNLKWRYLLITEIP